MIELGKKQILTILRLKEVGAFLGEHSNDENSVLLPKRQVPKDAVEDDKVEVFIYKDSEDRLIATTQEPKLTLGETGMLKVADTAKIGAFLDWGLEKDLLLPFKEQTRQVVKGEEVLAALYIDKSRRLCATMNVYDYLSNESPYQKDERVEGIIYEIKPELGAFVAVNNRYYGLIPSNELFAGYRAGERIEARVVKVREDGKLDLSGREKSFIQMDADAKKIYEVLQEFDGVLPFTDKASPEVIKREFNLSKNAFKRAVGRLLKEGRIRITDHGIEIIEQK